MPVPACRWLVATLALFLLPAMAVAQAPTITAVSPQAVRPGESVDVRINGANLAGATQLWTTFPCEAVLSPDVPENGKNAGQVVYRVTVPAEAPVGIHGVRIVAPGGVSPLRLLVVDDLPSVAQQGNNTAFSSAQPLEAPVAVDGTVANLTRQFFKFTAAANQKVSIEVLARRLGSGLDPMIRILEAGGRELVYSDDEPGLSADARLSFVAPAAGDYVIELRDIRYQGGAYRLRIGDFPCVSTPYPTAIKRGTQATVSFAGPDVEQVTPVTITAPTDPDIAWVNVGAKRDGGRSSGFAQLAISDADQALETEPNDTAETSTRIPLGAAINGRLEKPRDVDRFIFTAAKGQKFSFAAMTRRQGAPTDLLLRLLKADGGQVATAEDVGATDGVITYAFPADGDYTLVVEDLHRRGGPQFAYRVDVTPSEPGFSLAASANALNVPAGGTVPVTVTATRRDYGGPIALSVAGLPPGVTSTPTVLGPGINSVVLTLVSTAETAAGQFAPVKIVGTAKVGDRGVQATATVTEALKTAFSGTPFPPQLLAEAIAAGTGAAPKFTLRTEPAQIVFGKDLSATVKVIATRQADYNDAITLAVLPPQNGLPGGITAAVAPIPANANEVNVTFTANAQAPLGEFTAALSGTLKKGNETVVQSPPGIGLKLEAPFVLTVDTSGGKITKGTMHKIKVKAERNPAFTGAIDVTLANLPAGVTAAAAQIPADQPEVEVTLTAAADAAAANVSNIKAAGTANGGKHKAESANLALVVE